MNAGLQARNSSSGAKNVRATAAFAADAFLRSNTALRRETRRKSIDDGLASVSQDASEFRSCRKGGNRLIETRRRLFRTVRQQLHAAVSQSPNRQPIFIHAV